MMRVDRDYLPRNRTPRLAMVLAEGFCYLPVRSRAKAPPCAPRISECARAYPAHSRSFLLPLWGTASSVLAGALRDIAGAQ